MRATVGRTLEPPGAVEAQVGGLAGGTPGLDLPATTASSSGVVNLGGAPFLHGYGVNTFVGSRAGNLTMGGGGTSGQDNVAFGTLALRANTTGYWNTAVGSGSLSAKLDGHENTALGYRAITTLRASLLPGTLALLDPLPAAIPGTLDTADAHGQVPGRNPGTRLAPEVMSREGMGRGWP